MILQITLKQVQINKQFYQYTFFKHNHSYRNSPKIGRNKSYYNKQFSELTLLNIDQQKYKLNFENADHIKRTNEIIQLAFVKRKVINKYTL